jgi:phenylacetic acid degradation protein
VGGCYSIEGVVPVVHPQAFVHPDAVLIGDVVIGPRCYIGPFASLRGDMGRIDVREGANLQDGTVVHCFPGRSTVVDVDAHVGHAAVLHGCHVGPRTLIGIGAVLLDGVVVGEKAFVGAHSFVKANTEVTPGWLFAGSPARAVRELSKHEIGWKANGTRIYQELAARCLATMTPVAPLRELDADRPALAITGERAVPIDEHRTAAVNTGVNG